MSQKHYQSQFKVVLGVGAWPGTLNVDVSRESEGDFSQLRVISGLDEGKIFSACLLIELMNLPRGVDSQSISSS